MVLKLRRISSRDKYYIKKSNKSKPYLNGKRHKPQNVEKAFQDALNASRQQSRIKKIILLMIKITLL